MIKYAVICPICSHTHESSSLQDVLSKKDEIDKQLVSVVDAEVEPIKNEKEFIKDSLESMTALAELSMSEISLIRKEADELLDFAKDALMHAELVMAAFDVPYNRYAFMDIAIGRIDSRGLE